MARDTDDEAPWLAAAEPPVRKSARGQGQRTEVSRRSLFWTVVVLLTLAAVVAIALIIAFTRREGGSTAGYMAADQAPLITAEPGPYKVPPSDPRGLQVEGQDQTIYAAGEGIDPGSIIDGNSIPEEPLPRPGLPRDLVPEGANEVVPPDVAPPGGTPAVTPAPPVAVRPPASAGLPPAPMPRPATMPRAATTPPVVPAAKPPTRPVADKPVAPPKPAPETPAEKPAASGKAGTVQLGAFSSEDKANAAWAALAGKPGMAGMSRRIIKVEADGKTLYRLRASGGDAATLCARLKAAGQACTIVE